ncbi:MAG: flagellin [Thermodesulfobacteriaceae bacterium]|nr:flagellin [Thermodesulfobacteriaceae bacterium]
MAVKINFNEAAAQTHTALVRNERAMNKSLLRLSTGMRILNAADDSAGTFIADMLSTVAKAYEQGNRNIQTGFSALQIAEASAGQIFDKLQEIYVRAQNAANDINDPNARAALQREITNFVDAIQKIGTDTEYNGIKLLDGSFQGKYIHYGPRSEQTVTLSISSLKSSDIGANMVRGGTVESRNAVSNTSAYTALITGDWQFDPASDTALQLAGVNLTNDLATYYYKKTGSQTGAVDAKALADVINSNSVLQGLGISAYARNKSVASAEWQNITSLNVSSINIFVGPSTTSAAVTINVQPGQTWDLDSIITEINVQAKSNNTSLRAYKEGNRLVLETNGETIGVQVQTPANGSVNLAQFLDLTGESNTTVSSTAAATGSAVVVGQLTIAGSNAFGYNFTGISSTNAGLGIATSGNSTFRNLYSINVTTNEGAEVAMIVAEKALQKVDTVRAQIGATMNNLQSIFDSQKVAYDNTKEAESVIRNTDYAKEMADFTTYQIRMQATVAMLAQANTLPQLVLQLMR